MRLNGCSMLLGVIVFFGSALTVVVLALIGPTIGNIFSNVVTELETEPATSYFCTVEVTDDILLYDSNDFDAQRGANMPAGTPFSVTVLTTDSDGVRWFRGEATVNGLLWSGWLPEEAVEGGENC